MDTASILGTKDVEHLLRKVAAQQLLLKEAARQLGRLRSERRALLKAKTRRRADNRESCPSSAPTAASPRRAKRPEG